MNTDNTENWEDIPALHIYPLLERRQALQIVGSLEGLANLHQAILDAMVRGQGEAEVLLSDADIYGIVVKRQDLAADWEDSPLPIYAAEQKDETDAARERTKGQAKA